MGVDDRHGRSFITFDRGTLTRRVGLAVSRGPDDAHTIVMTNHTGKIDPSLLPEIDLVYEEMIAGAALQAGDFVHIKVQVPSMERVAELAEGESFGVPGGVAVDPIANGFVLEDYAAGEVARVYISGVNTKVTATDEMPTSRLGALVYLDRRNPGKVIPEHEVATLFNGVPNHAEPGYTPGASWIIQSVGRMIEHHVTSVAVAFHPTTPIRVYREAP